jgi:hypothetical protein
LHYKCRSYNLKDESPSAKEKTFLSEWNNSSEYSSWCKITNHKVVRKKGENIIEEEVIFGQLNYFIQLILPCDKLISGLAFGFVTVYKTTFDDERDHYFTLANDSKLISDNFYCLNNINSTNIGLSVLDRHNKPMNVQNNFNSRNVRIETHENSTKSYSYIVSRESEFEKIYFLELQPFRESIQYSSLKFNNEERNLEFTKVRIGYKCSYIVIYK